MAKKSAKKDNQFRYGIGEWFGTPFTNLTDADRKKLNQLRKVTGKKKRTTPEFECPFKTREDKKEYCNKSSAICTLRLYKKDDDTGKTVVAAHPHGMLRATCPSRFLEDNTIFKWVGKELLSHQNPVLLREVPYLEPVPTEGEEVFSGLLTPLEVEASNDEMQTGNYTSDDPFGSKGVGSIDFVLLHPQDRTAWCALELQSVYFSGSGMDGDFKSLEAATTDDIPFPVGKRRPDYRSSGPKRLMPQLQTKVPSLRRWGKKLAVVVDKWFWASLAKMDKVEHVSNCDIAWFVVEFEESAGVARLKPYQVFYTTLESAIDGLTAGRPVSLPTFENRLNAKTDGF
ncbi:MAG: NotI family restriction endonuclease [Symbiobacteriia bacterium]